MHDRPDEVPGPGLVGIEGDRRALVTRDTAPCAPGLGEEIEAEPGENTVQEREIRHDSVPGLFDQDRAFVILEIRDPQTFGHRVNSCRGNNGWLCPRFALPRTVTDH